MNDGELINLRDLLPVRTKPGWEWEPDYGLGRWADSTKWRAANDGTFGQRNCEFVHRRVFLCVCCCVPVFMLHLISSNACHYPRDGVLPKRWNRCRVVVKLISKSGRLFVQFVWLEFVLCRMEILFTTSVIAASFEQQGRTVRNCSIQNAAQFVHSPRVVRHSIHSSVSSH